MLMMPKNKHDQIICLQIPPVENWKTRFYIRALAIALAISIFLNIYFAFIIDVLEATK